MRCFLVIFVSIFYLESAAQPPLYTHFKWFKVEDGLPQSFISALAQDADGFLWIGTRDGLARYDGREFLVFHQDKTDSTGLSSNVITRLYLDPQNLLWVMHANKKLDCFDPRSLRVVKKDSFTEFQNLLLKYDVSKFFRVRRSGKFWFNTNYKGVNCYDPASKKIAYFNTENKTLASNYNLGAVENPQGKICIFTDKGLEISNAAATKMEEFIPFPGPLHFKFIPGPYNQTACLPNGDLILTETNRLIIYDAAVKNFHAVVLPVDAEKDIIRHILVKDGLLYVQAAGKVFLLEKNLQLTYLWQCPAIDGVEAFAVSFFVDRSNVLWFGTNAAGLYKVDLQSMPFTAYPYQKNFVADVLSMLPAQVAGAIPPSLQKGKWAYWLRYCYWQNTLILTYSEKNMAEKNSLAFHYSGNRLLPLPVPAGNHEALRGLSVSPGGILYAIGVHGNIWRWHNFSMLPDSVLSFRVPAINDMADMEADDNAIWISTEKAGLFEIGNNHLQKNFKEGTGKKDLPSSQLTDLCQDPGSPHTLWIGTLGQGLVKWNKTTGTEKIYTTNDGLPNNTIYGIVPDDENNLWLSTNKGICRLDLKTGNTYNFDISDGLSGNEFNRFHHIRLPDGRIAFGGPEGYTAFDPENFIADTFATPVVLTKLLINNTAADHLDFHNNPYKINQLTQLALPYNKNFLSFEFSGLEFNQPQKIRYRYKLEAYDEDWINAGDKNVATYTRLPAGKYTLLVNATNTSGNWSPFVKKLSVIISPPLWATWWAYTLYALIVAAIIYFLWRYNTKKIELKHELEAEARQTKKLKELDQIKTRFFANISHEFRTPLTLIMGPVEDFLKDNDVEKFKEILPEMHHNAARLLQLINQLLDLSKLGASNYEINTAREDIIPFVKQIVNSFSSLAHRKNIQLETEVDPHLKNGLRNETLLFYFDDDVVEKILFNLLSNAFKFTPEGGNIVVSISLNSKEEGFIELKVEDNGAGIPAGKLPFIFDRFYQADNSSQRQYEGTGIGLSLVKELVELHGGKITVASTINKGAAFSCYLPLNKKINTKPGTQKSLHPQTVLPFVEETSLTKDAENAVKGEPVLLLVEDQQDVRKYICGKLVNSYKVLEAKNGMEGLAAAKEHMPDLVISDVMMPVMDGFELCKLLKTDNLTSHIPVILLTARAEEADKLSGLETGADAYLIKPFNARELHILVKNLIAVRNKMRAKFSEKLIVKPSEIAVTSRDRLFMQQLLTITEQHIADETFSVEQLGKEVNMSASQINRKLKALVNQSAQQFIRSLRMQRAQELLKNNAAAIAEVAYQVGFNDPGYFARVFKTHFGYPPSETKAE